MRASIDLGRIRSARSSNGLVRGVAAHGSRRRARGARTLLPLLLVAFTAFAVDAGAETPAPRVVEIRFVGNAKTRPETLLRETFIRVGDPSDPDAIERSRQAVMDLELFKSVRVDVQPGDGGVILVFTVVEKRYLFVLPALGRSPEGDITYGVQGRLDNLRGRGLRLEVEAERTDLRSDAPLDDERTLRIHYQHPRLRNGPWDFDVDARYRRAFLDAERDGTTGQYERGVASLALSGARWKDAHGPSRGWRFGAGVLYEDLRFDVIEGDPTLYFDTTEVGLLGRVLYRDVRNFEYNRAGRELAIELAGFSEVLGSAKNRLNGLARWRSYNPIGRRRYTNVDYQLRVGIVNESLFGDPAFDLGGASGLRGYRRGEIEGNAYLLANVEFLTPLGRHDALRGSVFVDAGDAYSSAGDASLAHLKTAAGLGLRWKIRSFVRLELRVDVARGFDGSRGGDTIAYAGTSATF